MSSAEDYVTIYTDGACSGNPGPGSWAGILFYKDKKKIVSGYFEDSTTNNQMELVAVIESLKCLKRPCTISLYTDSIYVKDGITKWIHNWKVNSWKTASKKPVKNQELWMKLDEFLLQHKIEWHWIKGHSNNENNNIVDKIAREILKEKRLKN